MKFSVRDRVVVLTGAASGIGAALAKNLAERGAELALIDRDATGLEAIAETVRSHGHRVRTYAMDLSDQAAIRQLPATVNADLGPASVLINNAGMALTGTFEQVPAEQFERLMAVNFFATVAMVRAFLPQLRNAEAAQIVNLSSVYGIIGSAGNVAYSASKFAVRGFSESIRAELLDTNIGISVVHPGGVRTNIAASALVNAGWNPEQVAAGRAATGKYLRMDPRDAAARIVRGLERREKRILVGSDAKFVSLLQRLMPVSYSRFLPRRERRHDKGFGT